MMLFEIVNLSNHKLARSKSDASWFRFASMLLYKASWYGGIVVKAPTSISGMSLVII